MEIVLGLLIIAVGAFCQSSSYVPINKIKKWSWESYWLVQGIFAWLVFPLLGALLSLPEGQSFGDLLTLFSANPKATWLAVLFGVLWGVGGLTFGLSMRYLGVALGQSLALGTCAALGTILTPIFTGHTDSLTTAVIVGVVVTVLGIAIIGLAGHRRSKDAPADENSESKHEFNFTKGILVALLAGFMSACFSIGLGYGETLFLEGTKPIYQTLPATMLVTLGGFVTNAVYCLHQNAHNHTFADYRQGNVWFSNALFCILAGLLWYSQFFGLSLGKGHLESSPTLRAFSWCILMALNVTFSNFWGIVLKEWKGCKRNTIVLLVIGLVVLIISSFLPQLLQ